MHLGCVLLMLGKRIRLADAAEILTGDNMFKTSVDGWMHTSFASLSEDATSICSGSHLDIQLYIKIPTAFCEEL
jgi:hypothetical protein